MKKELLEMLGHVVRLCNTQGIDVKAELDKMDKVDDVLKEAKPKKKAAKKKIEATLEDVLKDFASETAADEDVDMDEIENHRLLFEDRNEVETLVRRELAEYMSLNGKEKTINLIENICGCNTTKEASLEGLNALYRHLKNN